MRAFVNDNPRYDYCIFEADWHADGYTDGFIPGRFDRVMELDIDDAALRWIRRANPVHTSIAVADVPIYIWSEIKRMVP